jgi:hypothetical protein
MKKTTLIIGITTLLINFSVLAQNEPIEFGLKAGLNYSNLIIDDNIPAETNAKIGFHLGGFLSFKLTGNFRIKPELLFSTQNAEIEFSENINMGDPNDPVFGNRFKADIKQNLILLPIMADYYFSENFDLEFGPQFGYVINQDITDNNNDFSFGNDDYDKFEVALNVGAGFTFAESYRIGLRYNYGITERDNNKSSVLQFGLSYKL